MLGPAEYMGDRSGAKAPQALYQRSLCAAHLIVAGLVPKLQCCFNHLVQSRCTDCVPSGLVTTECPCWAGPVNRQRALDRKRQCPSRFGQTNRFQRQCSHYRTRVVKFEQGNVFDLYFGLVERVGCGCRRGGQMKVQCGPFYTRRYRYRRRAYNTNSMWRGRIIGWSAKEHGGGTVAGRRQVADSYRIRYHRRLQVLFFG